MFLLDCCVHLGVPQTPQTQGSSSCIFILYFLFFLLCSHDWSQLPRWDAFSHSPHRRSVTTFHCICLLHRAQKPPPLHPTELFTPQCFSSRFLQLSPNLPRLCVLPTSVSQPRFLFSYHPPPSSESFLVMPAATFQQPALPRAPPVQASTLALARLDADCLPHEL